MAEKIMKLPTSSRLGVQRAAGDAEPDWRAAPVIDVGEMIGILRRNALLIVMLGVVSTALTYWLTSRQRASFFAEALIRIRDTDVEVAAGATPNTQGQRRSSAPAGADPMLSEIMVLTGRKVAGAVVDREGLRLYDPEVAEPWPVASDVAVTLPAGAAEPLRVAFDTTGVTAAAGRQRVHARYGQPVTLDGVQFTVPGPLGYRERQLLVLPREDAVDWTIGSIKATVAQGTDAITVRVTTPSPDLSVRLANAVVEEYQATDELGARESLRRRREFLEARLRETSDSLLRAQLALAQFRNNTGAYDARQQSQTQSASAIDAGYQLDQLVAARNVREGLVSQMRAAANPAHSDAFRTLIAFSDVSSNPVVSQLYERRSALERQRDELLAAGRPTTYPDVVQLQNLLGSIDGRLVDAIATVVNAPDPHMAALREVQAHAEADAGRLTTSEPTEVRLGQQVEALSVVGDQLRVELQQVRLAEAAETGHVEIVDRATRAMLLRTRRRVELVLGLVFGLFAGVAIAFLRRTVAAGLRGRADVEQALQIPGLAVVPQLPRTHRWERVARRLPRRRVRYSATSVNGRAGAKMQLHELVTLDGATNSAAGAYRALRTRLLFSRDIGARSRTLVVTSACSGEGKTTTAGNLAITLAQQGMRVLLVDSDLRQPRLHQLFGLRNAEGLTDVLLDHCAIDAAVQPTGIDRLYVLTSGTTRPMPTGPSELLGSDRMATLFDHMRAHFDMVVLDSPPVILAPDASILAARADGTLLVLRAGRTSRSLAQDALVQLTAVGATVVGAVLNDPDDRASGYGAYARKYGY